MGTAVSRQKTLRDAEQQAGHALADRRACLHTLRGLSRHSHATLGKSLKLLDYCASNNHLGDIGPSRIQNQPCGDKSLLSFCFCVFVGWHS